MLLCSCGRLGVLAVAVFLLSCTVWLAGCSENGAKRDPDEVASSSEETLSIEASIQAIRSLVASADTVVIESDSRKVLSSDLRQQLVRLMTAATVKPYGLRPGKPVGGLEPPPLPPPVIVLWAVDSMASPAQVKRENALVVLEVLIGSWTPFAQVYQPHKKHFLFESNEWDALVTAIEDDLDVTARTN